MIGPGLAAWLYVAVALLLPSSAAQATATTEGYVAVDRNIRLHYRVVGNGPQTVVIPAAAWWHPHVSGFAKGRRLILYDTRDRGRSDAVADSALISMQNEVRDLEALRRHLGIAQMNLIGWSYLGAMVALYAIEYPDHVASVVQVGPLPPRKLPYWDEFVRDRAARSDKVGESRVAEMRKAGVHERDPLAFCRAQWRSAVVAALADAASADAAIPSDICDAPNERLDRIKFGPLIEGLGDWDWRGKLASVRARVLLVHGSRENVPLESPREWVRGLGNARLLVVDGSGHFPFAEQPAVFARAIDSFLRGAWPEGAVRVP